MLKVLQLDIQAGFWNGRGQIVSIQWITEKGTELQKTIHICFIDYAKTFDCVDHNKLWKTLKEMGIPDRLLASCMQLKKQQLEPDMEQRLVPNWERSTSRLYIVTLLI